MLPYFPQNEWNRKVRLRFHMSFWKRSLHQLNFSLFEHVKRHFRGNINILTVSFWRGVFLLVSLDANCLIHFGRSKHLCSDISLKGQEMDRSIVALASVHAYTMCFSELESNSTIRVLFSYACTWFFNRAALLILSNVTLKNRCLYQKYFLMNISNHIGC